MDVREHNRAAWDRQVEARNEWTVPVSPDTVAAARAGRWGILLTPTRPVPEEWFPPLEGAAVLCLASGGGQQGPILAAAGADVTVLDNSPRQLAQDRRVASREGLQLRLVEGDMRDLSALADQTFDLIVHPVSNCFVPDVVPVWREAHRVLRPGGYLLSGMVNPAVYLFDEEASADGDLRVAHRLPYADTESHSPAEIDERAAAGQPLEFGHTLEHLIGGQTEAGFDIVGLYEDRSPPEKSDPLSGHMPTCLATRARRR